jgi:hypothetical protein
VNRVDALCANDRELMFEFSNRCITRLSTHLPVRVFLSLFRHFLDENVLKETEKDCLIISRGVAAFGEKDDRRGIDADEIFEMTKRVDNEFVKKIATPLLSIKIKYGDFEEIRKRRIETLLIVVFDLLSHWQETLPFVEVVRGAYAENRFHEVLREILHLYNLETRLLSGSISFHGPARKVKDIFAEKLFSVMEESAEDVAREYTRRVYVDKDRSCLNRT